MRKIAGRPAVKGRARTLVKSESLLKMVSRSALVGRGGSSVPCPLRFEPNVEVLNHHCLLFRVSNSVFHGGTTASGNQQMIYLTAILVVKASMLMLSYSTNLWLRSEQKTLRIGTSWPNCWKSTRGSKGSLWRISSLTLRKHSSTGVNLYLQFNWTMPPFS